LDKRELLINAIKNGEISVVKEFLDNDYNDIRRSPDSDIGIEETYLFTLLHYCVSEFTRNDGNSKIVEDSSRLISNRIEIAKYLLDLSPHINLGIIIYYLFS
jgi:hypothetical protein